MSLILRNAVNTVDENKALLRLMKSAPMQGVVQLTLERQPNIFESMDLSGHKTLFKVVEDSEIKKIVGCVGFAYRNLYVNGKPEEIVFASDVRVSPKYRGRGVLKLMAQGFHEEMDGQWTQGIVLKGNAKAEKVMLDKIPDYMPKSFPFEEMDTNLVFSRRSVKLKSGAVLRMATKADIPAMQALHDVEAPKYQFAPQYDYKAMLDGHSYYRGLTVSDFVVAEKSGEIIAFAGLWNQKANKQTRVVKYHWALKAVRSIYNISNKIIGSAQLPREGEYLDYLYMNSITCSSENVDVFRDIVAYSLKYSYTKNKVGVSISLSPKDSRIKALDGFSKSGVSARHFLVGFCDDPRSELDKGVLGLEVCRL